MRKQTNFAVISLIILLTASISRADNIYVSCYAQNGPGPGSIVKYDDGGHGSVVASLYYPTGIALDNNGNLYVGQYQTYTIEKFDSFGNRSTFAYDSYTDDLKFHNNNLYAINNNTIDKYDLKGNKSIFASNLDWPRYIAFDNKDNLYLTDHYSIYKYDPSGTRTTIASDLYGARLGLACDSIGNLYVSDAGDNLIEKYDTGENRSIFATNVYSPWGLDFDSKGNLYVASRDYGEILKFDSVGNRSVFASGLNMPVYVTTQVPEPATILLFGLSAIIIRKFKVQNPTRSKTTSPAWGNQIL